MKKMIFAAAIAQEKRNDMPTQGMNTLARERDYQAISERLSRIDRNRQLVGCPFRKRSFALR